MKKTLACALATSFILIGCATPPPSYQFSNQRTYNKSYDEVWESIIQFFASRNLAIKTIEKDSGIIFSENTGFDNSVADCGGRGGDVPIFRKASFNVFVKRVAEAQSVTMNTSLIEVRRDGWIPGKVNTINCSSKGAFEAALFAAIGPAESTTAARRSPATTPSKNLPQVLGRHDYAVQKMARDAGCAEAQLAAQDAARELYTASCPDGLVSIRCEWGQCAAP